MVLITSETAEDESGPCCSGRLEGVAKVNAWPPGAESISFIPEVQIQSEKLSFVESEPEDSKVLESFAAESRPSASGV